ncbi:hypothetical protein [Microbacterium sp. 18062]|uniref:hypothetical protein n=1 Tax=Microbacterium sp. 18062 TaxID=2681410 RepID=UPI00135970DE|nr:hypothetical protein [Microbacterium sp. 18062]
MRELADLLLESMVERDPGIVPWADRYAVTVNSVPGAPGMLSSWRTVTGVNRVGQYVVDPVLGQVFVTASLDEGGMPVTFWARLKVEDGRVGEAELSHVRARADGGFVMLAEEIGTYPAGWTSEIPAGGRATRDELERLGRAVFDDSLTGPEPSDDCLLMELGGVVLEDPDYIDLLMTGELHGGTDREKTSMKAGLMPVRPYDPDARIVAIDEEQGIVVVTGLVPGFTSPYVVRDANESCFVPAAMIEQHRRTLRGDWARGRRVVEELPATAVSTHVLRLHSGMLQGLHMFNCLTAAGGRSPWHDRT